MARKDYLRRIEAALGEKSIIDKEVQSELPVAMPHRDLVPIQGNMHLATGRTISRKEIDKRLDRVLGLRGFLPRIRRYAMRLATPKSGGWSK